MKKFQIKAFTLVELIIVITILAILRTIGFMSFQSYTLDARDGKRKRDLGVLRNGLEIYGTKNQTLLDPDNYAIISGTSLQGYASGTVLKGLRISDDTKDPKDKIYYTYSKDLTGKKYQLLAMLEKQDNLAYNQNTKFINETYAQDYTTRFPYTIGGNFGIYLSGTTQTPVQEGNAGRTITDTGSLTLITLNTGIVTGGSNLTITSSSITNSLCTTNGQIFYTDASGNKIGEVNNAGSTISGTPANLTCAGNIVVCFGSSTGYVLQACNLGLSDTLDFSTWKINETTSNKNDSFYGNYYQFGKTDNSWTNGNLSYSYDWKFPGGTDSGSANYWGVNNSVKSTATWSNSDSTNQGNMKGPCPKDYHVPTYAEWFTIYTSWGGGSNSGINLSNALKLPFDGYRNRSDGSIYNKGGTAYYWSSSPNATDAFVLSFTATPVALSDNGLRAYGFGVRCLKN